MQVQITVIEKSLPSRERGLKLRNTKAQAILIEVAPFAGAWIEIWPDWTEFLIWISRSLRGSVD